MEVVRSWVTGGTRKAVLALEDGSFFLGWGFGSVGEARGEVVFNTGMVGYVESLTDPSYKGQILVQTYPLIGNHGVQEHDFESGGIKVEGYVIRNLCRYPSHWSSSSSLESWLESEGVPGMFGVDTRAITMKLRYVGTMLGILASYDYGQEPDLPELRAKVGALLSPYTEDMVYKVSTDRVVYHRSQGRYKVVLLDLGVKRGIIRSLLIRGVDVIQVPASTGPDEILDMKPDGVVVSNGPGDPKLFSRQIECVAQLISEELPTLGICLGNQLVALALGALTFKLKFGHRGQNHPVIRSSDGRVLITSQNHSFAVKPETLEGAGLKIEFTHANDKTVEGLSHKRLPILTTQFHPEGSPGPLDSQYIFDEFIKMMEVSRK